MIKLNISFYKKRRESYKNNRNSVNEFLCYVGKLKYLYLDKTDYDLLPDEMVQACLSSDLLALEKREIETFEEVGDCTMFRIWCGNFIL